MTKLELFKSGKAVIELTDVSFGTLHKFREIVGDIKWRSGAEIDGSFTRTHKDYYLFYIPDEQCFTFNPNKPKLIECYIIEEIINENGENIIIEPSEIMSLIEHE